jgi:hypothetical protein
MAARNAVEKEGKIRGIFAFLGARGGLSLAETVRQLGLFASAISQILKRNR